MKYVIQCTDHGGFVSRPGSRASYTSQLQYARVWSTKEAADRERCPGNEVVRSVDEILGVR